MLFGAAQAGLGCIYTDIAPIYSSPLNSLGNTVGALAGIVGPIFVAQCTILFHTTDVDNNHTTDTDNNNDGDIWGWRVVFLTIFILSLIAITLWMRFIRADIVPALNTPIAPPPPTTSATTITYSGTTTSV